MRINVFGKKRTSKDGRSFYTYLSTIKKGGIDTTVEVKFREEVGNPKKVPCTIEFDKKLANYSEKEDSYTIKNDDGTEETKTIVKRVLWISDINMIESEYIDESMNDIE